MGAILKLAKQRIVQQHGIHCSGWVFVCLMRRALFVFGLFALSSLLTPSTLKARQPDEDPDKRTRESNQKQALENSPFG